MLAAFGADFGSSDGWCRGSLTKSAPAGALGHCDMSKFSATRRRTPGSARPRPWQVHAVRPCEEVADTDGAITAAEARHRDGPVGQGGHQVALGAAGKHP